MTASAAVVAVVCFYFVAHRTLANRLWPVVQAAVVRLRIDSRQPVRAVEAIGKLATSGALQLVFALVMLGLFNISPTSLLAFQPELVPLAALLGIGEFALASLLCVAAVLAFLAVRPTRAAAVPDWLARARGGWMSHFLGTVKAAPPWLAVAAVSLYIAVEELIFRGILITVLAPHGAVLAIGGSTALFVAVQAAGMRSIDAAVFPMIGAAVLGVIHGVIFWHVRDTVPLVAAHLTYLLAALRFTGQHAHPGLLLQTR